MSAVGFICSLDAALGKVYIHFIHMSTKVDLSACKDCRCLAVRRHARAITRLFEEKLRPHQLRATQFSVLAALALMGPTPVGELAETLGLERTTLTRIGAVLERHGWVSVVRSDDARERPFRLTGTGRRKIESAFPAWKEAQDLVDRRLAGPVRQMGFMRPRTSKPRPRKIEALVGRTLMGPGGVPGGASISGSSTSSGRSKK